MSNNLGNNGLVRPSGAREGMHRGPEVSPRRSGPTPQATCVRPSGAVLSFSSHGLSPTRRKLPGIAISP